MHPGNLLGRDSRQLDAWEEEINAALSKLPQHALQSFWNLAVPCLPCDSGVCHSPAYLANTLVGRYLPNNTDHTTRTCVSQWVTTTKNARFFNQSYFHKSYLMLNSFLFSTTLMEPFPLSRQNDHAASLSIYLHPRTFWWPRIATHLRNPLLASCGQMDCQLRLQKVIWSVFIQRFPASITAATTTSMPQPEEA